MADIIYEDDKYRIIVLQESRTLKKRSNIFTKDLQLYLGSRIGTYIYVSVALNYDKSNNTIITFFEYDTYLPNDMNCLRHQLKYNPLWTKRLYEYLFKDIKNKNYMREKSE